MNKLQINKREVDKFIKSCKSSFGENLVAVVLFGSRYWGFSDKESDYDLFVFVDEINQNTLAKKDTLVTSFPKFHIRYFVSVNDNRFKTKSGWASYVVLTKYSHIFYTTSKYKELIERLNRNQPNLPNVLSEYKKEKNRYEIDELKGKGGFKANEWAFFSIWKRIQIIDYYKNNKVRVDLNKNLSNANNILSPNDVRFVRALHKRTFNRVGDWNQSDYRKSVDILKQLNQFLETVST